jgi:hypothetical protein
MTETLNISEVVSLLKPAGLEEMDSISLMDRIETKYVVSLNRLPSILNRLNGNYNILEINGTRDFDYHNVYLDTSDLRLFQQHVTGRAVRYKVRFRKYVNTGNTYLEIKRKNNNGRTKKWRVESQLTESNSLPYEADLFINQHLNGRYNDLNPVLINRFQRLTLAGFNSCERITVDYDIRYSDEAGRLARFPYIAIIEVKRDGKKSVSPITEILKEGKIKPFGFSKYCMGTAAMKDIRHKNNLKAKFLTLNKLENEYFRSIYA